MCEGTVYNLYARFSRWNDTPLLERVFITATSSRPADQAGNQPALPATPKFALLPSVFRLRSSWFPSFHNLDQPNKLLAPLAQIMRTGMPELAQFLQQTPQPAIPNKLHTSPTFSHTLHRAIRKLITDD